MSHSTGITANQELKSFFAKCRDGGADGGGGGTRLIKVSIRDEQLSLATSAPARGDAQQDWDTTIAPVIEDDEPCYILYRLDDREGSAFMWMLISWSPDTASVRNKMLYASTKASLKKEFGGGQIKDELYGNVREDITFKGYNKHCVSAAAPGPMSKEEMEREEVKMVQANDTEITVNTKQQTGASVMFPFTSSALAAIRDVARGTADYVRLRIDVANELVDMEEKCVRVAAAELPAKAPTDEPRYHLFRFKHDYEGDYLESVVFIYTMPGYSCSIKERMLYSSCKSSVVERIENLDIEIAKKIEVDSGAELSEANLLEELHPKTSLNRPKFARPAGPAGRAGNKRMIKAPGAAEPDAGTNAAS